MPTYLTPQEFLNFMCFLWGLLSAWAVIKGLSHD